MDRNAFRRKEVSPMVISRFTHSILCKYLSNLSRQYGLLSRCGFRCAMCDGCGFVVLSRVMGSTELPFSQALTIMLTPITRFSSIGTISLNTYPQNKIRT